MAKIVLVAAVSSGQGKTTGLFVLSPEGRLLLHRTLPELATNVWLCKRKPSLNGHCQTRCRGGTGYAKVRTHLPEKIYSSQVRS